MNIFLSIVLVWAAFGGLGAWIATQKSRNPTEGFILGFIFGPVGCIIEAMLPTLDQTPGPTRFETEEPEEQEPDWRALGIEKPKPKGSLEGWRINPTPPKEPQPPPGAFDWIDKKLTEE